ncbi:MAG: hypothetical protein QM690_12295 [Sphingobium sp.]
MRRSLVALTSHIVLPLAVMTGAGKSIAAIGSEDRPAASMALDGRLLVETMGRGAEASRTVREATEARSGDRLIFLIRYRNRGGSTLTGYDFVSPVPRGVRILPDRADSVRISVDGGRHWSRPDSPVHIDAQGKLRPSEDLNPTHVRLRLDRAIAPGETGTVAYRGLLL